MCISRPITDVFVVMCCDSLQLDIDDLEKVRTRIEGRARLSTGDSPHYFGGVPDDYAVLVRNVGSSVRFIGCISDVIVNDK